MRQSLLLTLVILHIGIVGIVGCGSQLDCHVAPSISGEPSNQTAMAGQSALFTVAASGSAPLTFQWMENGVAIPGATQVSFLTPAVQSGDSGATFSVKVSNEFGLAMSSTVTLSVSGSISSNTFFIAPNGNDSNPGTMDQPFLTIQHCATSVPSGSTCAPVPEGAANMHFPQPGNQVLRRVIDHLRPLRRYHPRRSSPL
jgi:hypothetical protein